MNTIKKGTPMLQTSGDDKTLETLGGRIRAARVKAGLRLGAVAREIGLSRTSLSQWEAGMVKNPDVKKLGEFVRVTKVSLDWLLERKGGDPDLAPPQTTRRRRSRSADPAASDNAAGGLDLPIPEIAPQLSAHASQIDMTPRALWVLPHQVLEIGFNSVPEASVIKRVVTRGGMEFGLARGDYMIIDTSRQRVDEAGMYIVADPAGLSAFRVLINEKDGKLSVAAVADDLQRSNPQLSVDNLPTLGRVMGIFKPT